MAKKKKKTTAKIQATSESSRRVLQKITSEGNRLRKTAAAGKKPNMKFPVRSLGNVSYNPRDGYLKLGRRVTERTLTVNTAKTFAQSVRTMALLKSVVAPTDKSHKGQVLNCESPITSGV